MVVHHPTDSIAPLTAGKALVKILGGVHEEGSVMLFFVEGAQPRHPCFVGVLCLPQRLRDQIQQLFFIGLVHAGFTHAVAGIAQ